MPRHRRAKPPRRFVADCDKAREMDSLGRSIAYGEVNHVDVIDDLAPFLSAINLLNIPYEMLIGILPAMTYPEGPRLLLLIRGCAQTGRANARDRSALA